MKLREETWVWAADASPGIVAYGGGRTRRVFRQHVHTTADDIALATGAPDLARALAWVVSLPGFDEWVSGVHPDCEAAGAARSALKKAGVL